MSTVYKEPYSRTRARGDIERLPDGSIVQKYAGSAPGSYSTVTTSCKGGYSGSAQRTIDVVTPGYKVRSEQGDVFNNPFQSVKCTSSYGGSGPIVAYSGPWVAGQLRETAYDHANTNYHSQFILAPTVDAENNLVLPPELTSLLSSGIVTEASTKALAKVDASVAMGFASIGELKSTLSMLRDPLGGLLGFLKRYRFNTYRKNGKLVLKLSVSDSRGPGFVSSITSQYLEFYYGMKPFVNDIENLLDAYIREGITPERQTSRGLGTLPASTNSSLFTLGTKGVSAASWYDCRKTVVTGASCRAGILYVPTEATYRKTFGLRFGDLFNAAYELTPWSFFYDYFSNLGEVVAALSPRYGVRYLSAWNVVRLTQTTRVETIASGTGGTYYSQPRQGTEWIEQVYEATVRSPTSPYANIGLKFDAGNFSAKTKVLAMIALITQTAMKRIPILNF